MALKKYLRMMIDKVFTSLTMGSSRMQTNMLRMCTSSIICAFVPLSSVLAQDKYVYVKNTERYVSFDRGEWVYVGRMDENGEFSQEHKYKTSTAVVSGIPASVRLETGSLAPRAVYEFRSGVLIPGTM